MASVAQTSNNLIQTSGTELLVNTTKTGDQIEPRAAKLANGNVVVIWRDDQSTVSNDGNRRLKGQILTATGGKVGAEFAVDPAQFPDDYDQSVTALPNGKFVVTFSYGASVLAQVFDATGARSGGQLTVRGSTGSGNTTTYPSNPVVTALTGSASGRFVVTFDERNPANLDFTSYGQIMSETGTVGAPFALAVRGENATTPVVAATSTGFIAAWTESGAGYGSGLRFVARRFDNAGNGGAEFQVSTDPVGRSQDEQGVLTNPEIAVLTNGNFVVTWVSSSGTLGQTSGSAIHAQLFDASANRIGGEFLVNSPVNGEHYGPTVVATAGGGFVASWYSNVTPGDANSYGVSAQQFDANATKVGIEFKLAGAAFGDQKLSSIVLTASGLLAVFQSASLTLGDTSGNAIHAQAYTFANADQTASVTFATDEGVGSAPGFVIGTVAGTTSFANDTLTRSIANDSTGGGFALSGTNIVVADPSKLDFETNPNPTFSVRTTSANGTFTDIALTATLRDIDETRTVSTVGIETRVNTSTANAQDNAAVASLASGGYVVVWDDYSTTLGESSAGLKAQLYDTSGTKTGAEFRVNTQVSGDQTRASVAGLTGGGFVVTWNDVDANFTSYTVHAQLFTSSGAKNGVERTITAAGTSQQRFTTSSVTALSGGGYVVSWTDTLFGSARNADIHAQVYSATGTTVGSELVVNTHTDGSQDTAVVAALTGGRFVVAWADSGTGQTGDTSGSSIRAQMYSAAGARVGGEMLVNTNTLNGQIKPAIVGLRSGGFAVTWDDSSLTQGDAAVSSVKAQVYGSTGAKIGTELLVNSYTAGQQNQSAIGALDDGGFVVSWADQSNAFADKTGGSIAAQAFTATGLKIGGQFQVNTNATSLQNAPRLAGISGNRFVDAWTDFSQIGGDASDRAIKSQLFSLPAGNTAAVGNRDAYSLDEDTPLTVPAPGVLANDTDADGNALTVSVLSNPGHGTLSISADGGFTYTPTANYFGSDSFTYAPNDGSFDGNTTTVTFTIASVNDAPVATSDSYSLNEDAVMTVTASGVLANDIDVEGSALTAALVTGPAHGTVALNANGSFVYTPTANYNGSDSFTYAANDGTDTGNTATVALTVASVNDAPTATPSTIVIASPGIRTFAVADFGYADVDGDALDHVEIRSLPTSGDLTVFGSTLGGGGLDAGDIGKGYFGYRPAALGPQSASFTYRVFDKGGTNNGGTNVSATATLTFDLTALDNLVVGTGGDDSLDGGAGDDVLVGGGGNNSLVGGIGTDTASFAPATGNVYANLTNGLAARNGSGGTDSFSSIENLLGGDLDDVLIGDGGANRLTGGAGNDVLVGGAGDDLLEGGGGANEIYGGKGDDVYIVENAGDTLIEYAGEGIDEVRTAASMLTLRANFERLVYTGSSSFAGLGNASDNVIFGGTASDQLAGYDGNDELHGGTGAANLLIGGLGNDVYYVDAAGDTVYELIGEGIDAVRTGLASHTLRVNVENLIYTGSGSFTGIGNAGDNDIAGGTASDSLAGRDGNDVLRGGAGAANTLVGGLGDDVYYIDAVGDSTVEYAGEGIDEVRTSLSLQVLQANVENLAYTGSSAFTGIGNALDNVLRGGSGDDFLNGLDGNDALVGGSGADQLFGGVGNDTFRYLGGESGFDRIIDFTSGEDMISLSAAAFVHSASINLIQGTQPVGAPDGNSTFFYRSDTGMLTYDADGNGAGAAVNIAQLNTGLTLRQSDVGFG